MHILLLPSRFAPEKTCFVSPPVAEVIALSAEGHLYEWGDRSWLEPHRVLPPQVEDEATVDRRGRPTDRRFGGGFLLQLPGVIPNVCVCVCDVWGVVICVFVLQRLIGGGRTDHPNSL